MAAIASRETISIDMAGQFPSPSPCYPSGFVCSYQLFNCEYLCLIVSQLSILEEREEEENTEQKGAGGRSPEERLSRRSRETKWELLLHQSQGSGFPILQLEPAGESTQRQSPCDDFTGRHHCAVPQVPPSGPLCTKPPPCSPALLSIQPHCGPHRWTQT